MVHANALNWQDAEPGPTKLKSLILSDKPIVS